MKAKAKLSNSILALFITLLFICGATVVVLNFRPLYYFDIEYLDIPQMSGLSAEVIRQNYDALISYNSIFMWGELQLPTLPMSDTGRVHFEEVKLIFAGMQAALVLLLITVPFAAVKKLRKEEYSFLKLSAWFGVGIPAVLGAFVALNWERLFVVFHEIVFRNDYWQFNTRTDPVISILPSEFFMHCAICIIALVALCSILCGLGYVLLERRERA